MHGGLRVRLIQVGDRGLRWIKLVVYALVLDVGECCDACTEGNIAWVFVCCPNTDRDLRWACALKLVGAWCVLRVTSDACTGGATGNSPTCTGWVRWIRVGSTELNWFVLVCFDALRVRVGKLTYTYNGNYEWVFSGHHHRGLRWIKWLCLMYGLRVDKGWVYKGLRWIKLVDVLSVSRLVRSRVVRRSSRDYY